MRFGFVPILGSLLCFSSWFYAGFINKELGAIFFIMSFILVIIGVVLVFFFPLKKDKDKIIPFYRMTIMSFAILAIPGALSILYQFDVNMDRLIYIIAIFLTYRVYKSYK
jgi:heme/copper-type cytochrome/quinol oxidase subunit 4